MPERHLGEILVQKGVLTNERLGEALAQQQKSGGRLEEILVATHAVEENVLLHALAEELGLPMVETIAADEVEPDLVAAIPINFAKQHKLLPLRSKNGAVILAIADPLNTFALDDVRALLGRDVEAVVAPADAILAAINQVYERSAEGHELKETDEQVGEEELQDILDLTDEAPIIRWVNSLFYDAAKRRASDIHIEPDEKEVKVRFRIDGVLYETKKANKRYLPSIISRVKIMSGLNIAEKRLPQDGRISLKIAGRNIDIRVSTIPTSQGERVVLRLLDKTNVLLDLTDLGFSPDKLALIGSLIDRPHGIILVTGPTGAGKTTTLYACLDKINKPGLNILTVEDPVEYDIKGISQMQVQPKIGLTFATGLRHFLRQDPDVIMVGEIRDAETAEIAIHASLTGHLVLSTIHTNDAAGAVTRLVEMQLEPFLVASSLLAILAQRLVRVVCTSCRKPYRATAEELHQLGIDREKWTARTTRTISAAYALGHPTIPAFPESPVFYRAVGCDKCLGTGYLGRQGIYELLMVTDEIRNLVLKNADSTTVRRAAIEEGMDTLRDDGARQVLDGTTTAEEVMRVTQEDIE